MKTAFPFALAVAGLLYASGAAAQDLDRPPTAAEAAVIDRYRSAMNTMVEELTAGDGWQESLPHHFDIPEDTTVWGGTGVAFVFQGNIERFFEGATAQDGLEQKMTALQQEMIAPSTTAKRRQEIIAEITTMAQTPPPAEGKNNLLIATVHNVGNIAPDGEGAVPVDRQIPGVARIFREPGHQVEGAVTYLLEFGDPSRFYRQDDYYSYHYVHLDGSPHIETIEVSLQGPPAAVEQMLDTYDWTRIAAVLNP